MGKEPNYAWQVTCVCCQDTLTISIKEYTGLDERCFETHGKGKFVTRPNPLFFCSKCGHLCKTVVGIINDKGMWEEAALLIVK